MTRNIPTIHDDFLQQQSAEDTSSDTINVGTAEWFRWVEQHQWFAFENPRMSFTARKEQRPGGRYWYAYRRIRGKLHRFLPGQVSRPDP